MSTVPAGLSPVRALHLHQSCAKVLADATCCLLCAAPLDAERQDAQAAVRPLNACVPPALHEQAAARIAAGESAIRFRVPRIAIVFTDWFAAKSVPDRRSPIRDRPRRRPPHLTSRWSWTMPLMELTHVIRGEDHISNTPRQILLCGR
jgi:glutamyl/glutaminyl-tRNA synthetase